MKRTPSKQPVVRNTPTRFSFAKLRCCRVALDLLALLKQLKVSTALNRVSFAPVRLPGVMCKEPRLVSRFGRDVEMSTPVIDTATEALIREAHLESTHRRAILLS
jgi:hypothetical protein